jgi:hypothetical protein
MSVENVLKMVQDNEVKFVDFRFLRHTRKRAACDFPR